VLLNKEADIVCIIGPSRQNQLNKGEHKSLFHTWRKNNMKNWHEVKVKEF